MAKWFLTPPAELPAAVPIFAKLAKELKKAVLKRQKKEMLLNALFGSE